MRLGMIFLSFLLFLSISVYNIYITIEIRIFVFVKDELLCCKEP